MKARSNGVAPVARVSLSGLAEKYVSNLYDLLKTAIPSFMTFVPLIFFGIGLLGTSWTWGHGRVNFYFLSFIFFYWFGIVPLFHINLRYLTPMWPLCAVWIARGLDVFWTWLQEHEALCKFAKARAWRPATAALAGPLLLLLLFSFLPELGRVLGRSPLSTDRWADAVELKAAGLWLRQHGGPRPVVMSRNHAVSFYAGNYNIQESVTIPEDNLDRVLIYARHRRVNYLVLSERYRNDYSQLASLLVNPRSFDALDPVYLKRDASGLVTVIYRVL